MVSLERNFFGLCEVAAHCQQRYPYRGLEIKIVVARSWRERAAFLRHKTDEQGLFTRRCSETFNRIWGTEDNIFAAYDHPLHETDEDLLYRQELKDLLWKHSAESIITTTIPVSALKENVSLNMEGGIIGKDMTAPWTLLHAEIRDKTILVKEEMGLLEEPTYECISSLEDQCEEKLTTPQAQILTNAHHATPRAELYLFQYNFLSTCAPTLCFN